MEINCNAEIGTLAFGINDYDTYEFTLWLKQHKNTKYKIFMVVEGFGQYAVVDYQERLIVII